MKKQEADIRRHVGQMHGFCLFSFYVVVVVVCFCFVFVFVLFLFIFVITCFSVCTFWSTTFEWEVGYLFCLYSTKGTLRRTQ